MPKRQYLLAIACYLAIPVVMFGGAQASFLIDPELARRTSNYVRNYRRLETLNAGIRMATAGLAVGLWAATCSFLLKSKGRSPWWLPLAAGGPLGFAAIAALDDTAPLPADRHQRFVQGRSRVTRALLECAVFVGTWTLAFAGVFALEDLQVRYLSYSTGVPMTTVLAERNSSSGMYAFAELAAAMYLFALMYVLWPVCFNLIGAALDRRARPSATS